MLSASNAWPQRLWRGRQQMQQRKRRQSSASKVGLFERAAALPVGSGSDSPADIPSGSGLLAPVCALHMLSAFVLCADCCAACPVVASVQLRWR